MDKKISLAKLEKRMQAKCKHLEFYYDQTPDGKYRTRTCPKCRKILEVERNGYWEQFSDIAKIANRDSTN